MIFKVPSKKRLGHQKKPRTSSEEEKTQGVTPKIRKTFPKMKRQNTKFPEFQKFSIQKFMEK